MAAIFLLCQLLFICIALSRTDGLIIGDYSEIIGACKGSCNNDLRHTNEGGSQLFCDQTCSVEQCWKGCTLYQAAVNSSCPRACTASYHEIVNVTGPQSPSQDQMRNCIQGCIFALDHYSISVKDDIRGLDQPVLDRETLNASSLTLKWKTPILSEVTYKLQKKMVGVDNGWHLHDDTVFAGDERIELTSLHPYVTYKFKVLALLSPLPDHIMYSNETADITTLAHGAPSTPPYITSLSTPSPRVISLSWSPPQFTNGKLVGYRLYVEPLDHPVLNQTTIEVLANTSSWLLSQLQSSQKYKISLSAWNAEGEGPRHSRIISTPNPGNLSEHETAYLLLGMQNKIIKRNILDVIQHATKYSDNVYANPNSEARTTAGTEDTLVYMLKRGLVFKDLGIHIGKKLIFATDSNGQVTKIHLNGTDPRPNIYPYVIGARAIAVDWLADRVYVATTERIYSCPLEPDRCLVVVQGLARAPSDLKVDPINGFIYYVIPGSGLYRVDLGDIHEAPSPLSRFSPAVRSALSIRRPSASTVKPQLVIAMSDMLTHIIDLYNVHLYVVNNKARKMMTTFLDGSNARPFHEKIIRSEFYNVSSMIFFNQTFIWTNGTKMFVEEHESPLKDYRHNEMLFFEPPYAGINVFHPSTQPTPVPSSAPDNVEGLFSKYRVVVKWMPPPILQYQGKGAWMNWTYELQMTMMDDEQPQIHATSSLKYVVSNLKPDTEYRIQVRAMSTAGRGPWSKVFIGRTLLEDGLSVLIGLPGGEIIEKNISSDGQRSVVSFFSDSTDVAWHEGIIFWVTKQGRLGVYDQTTRHKRTMSAADRAYCVAYDWLAKKVFWSDPSHVAIYRSDINGISSEFIRRTAARDIAIDAMRGRLYWATQNSIETSYLNGDNHQELFTIPPFSGPNVISLTLDMDSERVFWYVKGSDTQSLFVTELIPAGYIGQFPAAPQKVGDFKSIASTSGLQYFANRLFWLSEKHSLVMGDSQCNFTATVGEASNITSFVVIQPSNTTKNNLWVIPNQIRSEDIKSEGYWSSFNLTWPKSSEVTHGTVFYRVIIEVGNTNKQLTTTNQWSEMLGLSPYTQLVVSIQPYTYWGYAVPTTVSVRSPMSKPTAPLSPEVYIIQHNNATTLHQSLAADFRWMSPALTNGIISHHIVYHWMGDGTGGEKTEITVKSKAQHFILSPLVKNQVYNFKVVACNDAGCGPESVTKTVVTDALNPIPSLLMATPAGLNLTEMDSDFNSSVLLPDISPLAVTFLAQEDTRIFWLDKRNKLYENSGIPFVELLTLNGTGKDLTTDWVSRTLYFVESTEMYRSTITQFSIDRGVYQPVLSRPAKIYNIVADPYNSALVWIEIDSQGESQIMSADMTSGDVKAILGSSATKIRRRKAMDTKCSCTESMNFVSVLAMGYTRVGGATEIVFADSFSGVIFSSDLNGCMCSVIFKPSEGNRHGLPPSMLAVDHMRVTWYNKTEGKLYSVNKATGQGLIEQEVKGLQDILAYGSHLQFLPDSQCLDPGAIISTTQAMYVDSSSVFLKLSVPQRPASCQGISAPQDKYTIYYRKVKAIKHGAAPEDCHSDISQCTKMESYASNIQIKDLDPHTKYLFQVAISNYYTEYLSVAMGQPVFVTTKFGVPSVARELSAEPCTPEKIIVKWRPPLQLNGPSELITYVVQYSTFLAEGNVQRETENLFDNKTSDGFIQTVLKDLEPGHLYSIKVLTCMVNRTMCSSSEPVSNQTFKTPSDMKFVSSTPHSIYLTWRSPPDNSIIRHHVMYTEVKPGGLKWFESGFLGVTENHTDYTEEITGLEPNTLYAFKIKANYRFRPFDMAVYIWPTDDNLYTYRTNVFCPDQPPPPVIIQLKTGMYEVKWEQPDDNGASIINYILELSSADNLKWQSAYNGSDKRWVVDSLGLDNGKPYIFRVAAANSQGMGPYSNNSSSFLFSHAAKPATLSHQVIIGIVVGVLVFLIIIVVAVIVLAIRKRQEKITQFIIRGPDTELATLRELPHTTFQQSNTLYAISIKCTDEEIAKLPHFSRNQLVLTMFLGSGAFGEVFEGLAKNILGDSSGETKCAVKTLRKSASDHEKEEFLKEALLMKNFQHENILRLLGVCLDNDPQFIIMELMEGGDLLSFLRNCRATSTSPAKLVLPDLVKICVHVARGCKYLEDMHFVHRDLAARNCLVSSKSTSTMTVKIGDFGLARDIYKNDYYRKEGEGLLPVRWMSPESLVDGFFTTQSDIWAFGVLMWEVLTLGQQPYPARTNIEVLHFVRDGGKLERPEKCTDEMFNLMRKCWSFNSDQRPSFATLLESLEIFQEKCCHMSPEDIARFSPAVTDANDDGDDQMSDEDDLEEEEAVTRGLFTPDNPTGGLLTPKGQTLTGGGSVRLTQSAKQKRLNDLLGSPDAPEKLVVDLTKIGRKRTHSLEYSTKQDADSQNQFPAAANYDHNGYLEPRGAKGGPGYLELINYAPELRHLRDAQGNPLTEGSAFTPVHITRKGHHPSHVNYTLLTPDEDGHSGAYGPDGSDVCGVDDPTYYTTRLPYSDNSGHPQGYMSVEESPIYSPVCDDRRHYSTDSAGRQFGNAQYYPQLSGQSLEAMLLKSNQHRKYSDQDLYFSTKPYRQRQSSSSSSTNDHRYASVECNNNYSNPAKMLGQPGGYSSESGGSGYPLDNGSSSNSRRRHGSNHSNYLYAKPGIGYPTNGNVTLTAKGDNNTKPCSGNDSWANNLDDVFLDNVTASQCSSQPDADAFNYQSQQYHSSRSRGQVFPEHATAILGYESNQVSLV